MKKQKEKETISIIIEDELQEILEENKMEIRINEKERTFFIERNVKDTDGSEITEVIVEFDIEDDIITLEYVGECVSEELYDKEEYLEYIENRLETSYSEEEEAKKDGIETQIEALRSIVDIFNPEL